MVELYLYLLIAICIGLLGWGLIRLERIYQYPFFMGGIFVSFILPQAIALINNPGAASTKAVERVLIMSCFCAAMCWLGYQLPPSINLIKKLDIAINPDKLLHGGIVFILIGYISSFLIFQLPEAVRDNTQWTGIITVYGFFGGLIYPGLTIVLLSALQRPTVNRIVLTIFASFIPLQTIVLYGRRQVTATFILTLGTALYFFYRYIPPRWLALTAIVSALFIIPLIGDYRAIAKAGEWSQITELRPFDNLKALIEKGQILELRNAALLIDSAVQTGQYGFGTGYWDGFVSRFVPAQFVGLEFKNDLQLNLSNFDFKALYGYSQPTGATNTGIGDAFVQFDYFGSLYFAFLGFLFKNLWLSATFGQSVVSQLFYISLITPAMRSVTHGTLEFPPTLFFYFIFLGAVIIYSKDQPSY